MKTKSTKATPTKADKRIRWTPYSAEIEFGTSRATILKRLTAADIRAGQDGKFSTREICSAIFGDLPGQRLAKLTAEARLAKVMADQSEGKLCPISKASELVADLTTWIKEWIMGCELPDETKRRIVTECKEAGLKASFWNKPDHDEEKK